MPQARGVALVDEVIASVAKAGGRMQACGIDTRATPVPAAVLARLTLPDSRPLPASLARWLAYDASYLGLRFDPKRPVLPALTFTELCEQEFPGWGGVVASGMWDDYQKLLSAPCLLLPGGSDSRRFLYLGRPDALGEYPVMVIDTDDVPFVCVYDPGFDVWLAEEFGVLGWARKFYESMYDHRQLGKATEEQARLNLGGFRSFGLSDTEHVDGTGAMNQALAEMGYEEVDALDPMTGETTGMKVMIPPVPATPARAAKAKAKTKAKAKIKAKTKPKPKIKAKTKPKAKPKARR